MISWTSFLHHFEALLAYDHQLTMAGNLHHFFYISLDGAIAHASNMFVVEGSGEVPYATFWA